MRIFAIIPAGGKGLRSGSKIPKQYIKIYGRELIAYTLEIFQNSRPVDEIIISAGPAYFKKLEQIKKKYRFDKITSIVEGGKERQDSVYNALKNITGSDDDLVIVHDAARAMLSKVVLARAISTAKEKGSAVVCLKAKDTLLTGDNIVKGYLNRDEVFYVQTPQIFRYGVIMKAFDLAYKKKFYGTDESMLVKKMGEKIYISEGSVFNQKITSREDIELFRQIIKSKNISG